MSRLFVLNVYHVGGEIAIRTDKPLASSAMTAETIMKFNPYCIFHEDVSEVILTNKTRVRSVKRVNPLNSEDVIIDKYISKYALNKVESDDKMYDELKDIVISERGTRYITSKKVDTSQRQDSFRFWTLGSSGTQSEKEFDLGNNDEYSTKDPKKFKNEPDEEFSSI